MQNFRLFLISWTHKVFQSQHAHSHRTNPLDFGGFETHFFCTYTVHTFNTEYRWSLLSLESAWSHGMIYMNHALTLSHTHRPVWLHCRKHKGSDSQSIPAEAIPTLPECVQFLLQNLVPPPFFCHILAKCSVCMCACLYNCIGRGAGGGGWGICLNYRNIVCVPHRYDNPRI